MKVHIEAEPLQQILQALIGAPHEIRELQAISGLPGHDCPIKKVCEQYNKQVAEYHRKRSGSEDYGTQYDGNPDMCEP